MTPFEQAQAHLAKAREFLEVAEFSLDLELFNAATSDAVICGIHCKDAICLKLTGRTGKADDHKQAVEELRNAGPAAAPLASTLNRLLNVKSKSQYQTASMAQTDARLAVTRAEKLFDVATSIVTS
jgi:uncharacterized protein (UPF0332 family)